MQVCPNCGEENPPKFRLCGYCGTPLAAALPAQELRKTVTIVFSDLKGSTDLGERVDSEALRELLARYFEEMRAVLEHHGGRVEKYIGDAIMAVFGLPRIHEDDAIRAVRAADEMKRALHRLNDELESRWGVRLENRTGVNTGEVVAGDSAQGQRLVTGDAVNVAARLEGAAPVLEVLIGEPTYRLVRDAVEVEPVEPLELKGKAERVPAYRLLSVKRPEEHERRHDSPLVGRGRELERLAADLDAVRETGVTRIVTVLADAGVGKSRLVEEFTGAVAGADVLRGRCLPYGRGITFWPVREMVTQAARIEETDAPDVAYAKLEALASDCESGVAERVASAVGLVERRFALAELFWSVRELLAGLARERPLVVVFEDIHWAEPTLLDLIEYLGGAEVPALVVCASRPDIVEIREGWGSKPGHALVELGPLSATESELVVANLLGETGLPRAVLAKVTSAAEGNPLYVEQLLSMLIDDGVLRREGDRWLAGGDVAEFRVPPTINALLAARLDLLTAEERTVVDGAAVIGLVFPRSAVEALVPEGVRPVVPTHLETLSRRRLVRPHAEEEDAFRFLHILVRDAAYQALLKRARASYHERFADWAERVNRERERETEYEEILGYHLEQAYRYLSELGPLDERGRRLGARAAEKLSSAGRRAFGRGDMPAAANLLRRVVELLPDGDERRLELLPVLGEAMMEIGEFAWAQLYLDEALAGATDAGDERLRLDALLTRLLVVHHVSEDLETWRTDVLRESAEAIPALEELDAHAVLAKAFRMVAFAHGSVCQWAAYADAAQQAIEHARLAGEARLEARATAGWAQALRDGPTPVAEAADACAEMLARGLPDRQAEALVACCLACFHAMEGDAEEGRRLCADARTTLQDLGAAVLAGWSCLQAARVELYAGRPDGAEAQLREGIELLEAIGERFFRPLLAAALAQVVYRQERLDEVRAVAAEAEELADPDDVETQALLLGVRGKLLAAEGDPEAGERLVREALARVLETDAPVMQADAWLDLADVLVRAGRADEARAALGTARGLYERKGATVAVARVDELVAGLDVATRA